MEELGMKELRTWKNRQWEFAFGDIGEVTQDAHEDDEFPETEPEKASNQQCMLTTAEESDEECNLTEVLKTLEEKEIIGLEVKGKLTAIYKSNNDKSSNKLPFQYTRKQMRGKKNKIQRRSQVCWNYSKWWIYFC